MYFFKNAIIYKADLSTLTAESLEESLSKTAFTSRASMELSSCGWTKPFERHLNRLSPDFRDVYVINLQYENAVIPADTVKRAVNDKVAVTEEEQARKVRKKERDEIKETVMLELMPRALSKYSNTHALLMPKAGLIIVEATSCGKAEELLSRLRKSLGSLPATPLRTNSNPDDILTCWVLGNHEIPEEFRLLRSCELHDSESNSPLIRLKDQDLTSHEVRAHVEGGMIVTKLALKWRNQFEFTLHDDLSIHGLKLTDQYAESVSDDDDQDDALMMLDADIFRLSNEFEKMHSDIMAAFGGEFVEKDEAA